MRGGGEGCRNRLRQEVTQFGCRGAIAEQERQAVDVVELAGLDGGHESGGAFFDRLDVVDGCRGLDWIARRGVLGRQVAHTIARRGPL